MAEVNQLLLRSVLVVGVFVWVNMISAVSCVTPRPNWGGVQTCETIKVPLCMTMPYNITRLPNLLQHANQENVILALEQFEILRWTQCSPYLVFFLCAVYTPLCTRTFHNSPIPPCKEVCEAAYNGCEPLLRRFGLPWPEYLQCQRFPSYDNGVCITPDALASPEMTPKKRHTTKSCRCFRNPRLKRRLYNNRKFAYALRGVVRITDTFGELTVTNVHVKDVYKKSRVRVDPNTEVLMWTNSSCACPRLEPGREYLLLGFEDAENQRLLHISTSLALEWRKKYAILIKNWESSSQSKEKARSANKGKSSTPSPPNKIVVTTTTLATSTPTTTPPPTSTKGLPRRRGRTRT